MDSHKRGDYNCSTCGHFFKDTVVGQTLVCCSNPQVYPVSFYEDYKKMKVKSDILLKETTRETQVGGDHYKKMKIQPGEYVRENELGWYEGNVIKYVSRHKEKNGIEDIEKAIHYCKMILEEYTKK